MEAEARKNTEDPDVPYPRNIITLPSIESTLPSNGGLSMKHGEPLQTNGTVFPGKLPTFPSNIYSKPNQTPVPSKKQEEDAEETKDPYWRDVWHHTGQELGVSGLRYATSKTEPIARRILWGVLIISGLSFMMYQIVESFQEYYDRSSSTAVDDIFPDKLRFPTLTICNENKIMRSKAKALGLEAVIESLNPPWYGMGHYPSPNITTASLELMQAYQKYNFSSQEEFVRSMSYSYSDIVFGCFFASKECNASLITEVWTDMGLCFQFNPASQNIMVDRAGSNYGLGLLVSANQHDYIDMTDYAAGFRLKAETPDGFVSMAHDSVRVSPGHITSIQLHQTDTLLLGPPYGNCSDHRTLRRFSDYSSFHCETECLVDYIVDRCGCTPMQYPSLAGESTCTIAEDTACVTPAYYAYIAEDRGQSCACEPECAYTTYDMTYSSNVLANHFVDYVHKNVTYYTVSPSEIKENFAAIQIYYPRLSYVKLESQIAYTTTMLFNDLGGALGLMLGSTFFTVYEVLDIFIWAGIYRCREKKKVRSEKHFNTPKVRVVHSESH